MIGLNILLLTLPQQLLLLAHRSGDHLQKIYISSKKPQKISVFYLKAGLYERTPLRVGVCLRGRGWEVSVEEAGVPLRGRL